MAVAHQRLGIVLWNLLVVWVLFMICEGSVAFLLNHPPRSGWLLEPLHEYYRQADRVAIQYLPSCSRWDPTLGYTLRPGRCRFINREFNVELSINGAGLRDDEASLKKPEIIVLGDSHAMGWGVEDDETYARVIEENSGRKVLNAAISSFGTVRELMLLSRLDTSNLRWLFIQYSPNDANEVRSFIDNDRKLSTMTKARYRELVTENETQTRYHFGRHTTRFIPIAARSLVRPLPIGEPLTDADRTEARGFLEVLNGTWNIPVGVGCVVLEINKLGQNDSLFIDALRDSIESDGWPKFTSDMRLIDLSTTLTRKLDYFAYDGHMTAQGHRSVAERILSEVGITK